MSQINRDQFINTSALYFKIAEKDKVVLNQAESNKLLAEFKSFPGFNAFSIIETAKIIEKAAQL